MCSIEIHQIIHFCSLTVLPFIKLKKVPEGNGSSQWFQSFSSTVLGPAPLRNRRWVWSCVSSSGRETVWVKITQLRDSLCRHVSCIFMRAQTMTRKLRHMLPVLTLTYWAIPTLFPFIIISGCNITLWCHSSLFCRALAFHKHYLCLPCCS